MGSSPLTRGKLVEVAKGHCLQGLIPAHAGKTRERFPRRERSEAHPRSRGENLRVSARPHGPQGSSPLTRGKREAGGQATERRRLIPAHAGKTMQAGGRFS